MGQLQIYIYLWVIVAILFCYRNVLLSSKKALDLKIADSTFLFLIQIPLDSFYMWRKVAIIIKELMKKRRAFLKTFLDSFELNPNSKESFRSEIYHYSHYCSAFALTGSLQN